MVKEHLKEMETISIFDNRNIPISYTVKTLNTLTLSLLSNSTNIEFFYHNNEK